MLRYSVTSSELPEDVTWLQADGFEGGLIGVGQQFREHGVGYVGVYSIALCIGVLMDRDGMTLDESMEYMEFNVLGSYVGPDMPVFIWDLGLLEGRVEDGD